MHGSILELEKNYKKARLVPVRSGDTLRITQKIREASKERLQAFEGLVIRVDRANSLTCRATLRRLASGVWVEKGFLLHSPNVVKVEVLRRAKVRRNYLSYMRQRIGKAARLKAVDFDKAAVNEFAQSASPLSADEERPDEAGQAGIETEEPGIEEKAGASPAPETDEARPAGDSGEGGEDAESDVTDGDDAGDEDEDEAGDGEDGGGEEDEEDGGDEEAAGDEDEED